MKHTEHHPISLSTIPVQTIYTLVCQFCQQFPLPQRRGRPSTYPEPLILALALLKTLDNASYRRLLWKLAPDLFPNQPLPALGTLVYRLQQISPERLQQLLTWLAQQGIEAHG